MKKLSIILLVSILVNPVLTQDLSGLWQDIPESAFARKDAVRRIVPKSYRTLTLDLNQLQDLLDNVPEGLTSVMDADNPVIRIPLPEGDYRDFRIVEAPIMHPDLEARYPGIRSFAGYSPEDPTAFLRFGITPKGFHGMLLSSVHSSVFIDAYAENDTEHYICYFKKDFSRDEPFECLVDQHPETKSLVPNEPQILKSFAGDCTHRTYALALACTGEYAQYHGGTKSSVMAEFNIAMTRINGIYEREVGVTMVMVANTDDLIFLNASTDPYTNNNGATMLGQNQTTCDNIIGNANYGIGHVFSTGGGGIANLRSVCRTGFKARGVTGLGNPVGDPFYVDYVAHEMGHQFGGNHTQNNSCNRHGPTAMEPGSASTIMGYAGICSPNVQNNSDDYFHAISIDEMASHITGPTGNSCPIETNTDNNAPTVTVAGATYNVPISTPFVLTATGSDPDGNASLSYCWEQMDNEVATMPPVAANTGGPAFRSLSPTASPSRYFPNLPAILSGSTPTWEVLPSVSRLMNFRCTVRDNHPGGGCTDETDVTLNFSASAGPFRVTSPNTSAITWVAGSNATVTWNVANTNVAPVLTSQVEILLSIDGGSTYPYVLDAATLNDGNHTVTVPNVETTLARVMVKAINNVYFDISNQNFTIEMPAVPSFLMASNPSSQTACPDEEVSYILNLESLAGFNEEISFNIAGLPPAASLTFSPATLVPPGMVTVTISGLQNIPPGLYSLDVEAQSLSVIRSATLELVVQEPVQISTILDTPHDGAAGLPPGLVSLSWNPVNAASEYQVEVSVHPIFQVIVFSDTVTQASLDLPMLNPGTVYYWRVKAANRCNEGPFSAVFAFQTAGTSCETYQSGDVPVVISPSAGGTVTSTLEIPAGNPVTSVSVLTDIAHTYVGDLKATLQSPQGTQVVLFDQPGVPASVYGCNQSNLFVIFYDDAPFTAEELENTCNTTPVAITGEFQPVQPLSTFVGENGEGTWELIVEDLYPAADGGAVTDWVIELCRAVYFPPATLLRNEILYVDQGQTKMITGDVLQSGFVPAAYEILTFPVHGTLWLNGLPLTLGGSFTQNDLENGLVTYEHNGSLSLQDSFRFDLVDDASGWLHDQVFQIRINDNSLVATTSLVQGISCHDTQDAIIQIQANGGVPPLSFSMNGGPFQSSPVFENLGPGTYEFVVSDLNGVTSLAGNVSLTAPSPILIDADTVENDIIINASGGTGLLAFSIDGSTFQNSPVFEDLANGLYTISVQDENGCTATTDVTIFVNTLFLNLVISEPIICYEGNGGVITAMVSGGSPPYLFSLDGGPFQPDPGFSGLSAGTYTVFIQDQDGLTGTAQITLPEPPAIAAAVSVTGYEVSVWASGGTGDLLYSLDGGVFQSDPVFYPVPGGQYNLTIRDENGCEVSFPVTVTVPALGAELELTVPLACWYSTDAQIDVTALGGLPPYEYSLNGGTFQSSSLFTGLSSGNYQVTIRDSGGFTVLSNALTVVAPPQISLNASAFGPEITVVADGGTGMLAFSLDGGPFQPGSQFEAEWNGIYTVLAQDENGCTAEVEVVVNKPEELFFTATDPGCTGSNDGSVVIDGVNGGYPPYQFSLNGGPFSSGVLYTGLSGGEYLFVVMDATGYEWLAHPILIVDPPLIELLADVTGDTITVHVTGGTPPYLYSIDGGMSFQDENVFSGLSNGDYDVLIMDANECRAEALVQINLNALKEESVPWKIEVFPNPGRGVFRMQTNKPLSGPLEIRVYDAAGKLVYVEDVNRWMPELLIDLRFLANGNYQMWVRDEVFSVTKRLIILKN